MYKVQRVKVSSAIVKHIENMLRNGDIKEGDKLPSENVFAEQLGVSRMSLREALHTLQLMGVVTQRPKVGTVVVIGNPDLWPMRSRKVLSALEDRKDTMDLLEARRIIEGAIAKVCVRKIDVQDTEVLRTNIENMKEALDKNDIAEYVKFDNEFHYLLGKATKNPYLINVLLSLLQRINQFMEDVHNVYPGIIIDSFKFHSMVFEDILDKNSSKAERDMKSHITMIMEVMEKYYSQKNL